MKDFSDIARGVLARHDLVVTPRNVTLLAEDLALADELANGERESYERVVFAVESLRKSIALSDLQIDAELEAVAHIERLAKQGAATIAACQDRAWAAPMCTALRKTFAVEPNLLRLRPFLLSCCRVIDPLASDEKLTAAVRTQ